MPVGRPEGHRFPPGTHRDLRSDPLRSRFVRCPAHDHSRRTFIGLLAVGLAVTVSGCGDSSDSSSPNSNRRHPRARRPATSPRPRPRPRCPPARCRRSRRRIRPAHADQPRRQGHQQDLPHRRRRLLRPLRRRLRGIRAAQRRPPDVQPERHVLQLLVAARRRDQAAAGAPAGADHQPHVQPQRPGQDDRQADRGGAGTQRAMGQQHLRHHDPPVLPAAVRLPQQARRRRWPATSATPRRCCGTVPTATRR